MGPIVDFGLDPIAIELFGFSIYWYGICWFIGIYTCITLFLKDKALIPLFRGKESIDNLAIFTVICGLIGGKLGYLLFYGPHQAPWMEILTARSGLSFHGGIIGGILGLSIFCILNKLDLSRITDRVVLVVPMGIFFGRIGNFLNSELYGIPTQENFGVIFSRTDSLLTPRYPTQLIEAFFEGLILYLVLKFISEQKISKKYTGINTLSFLIFYGTIRFIIEFIREPDKQIGFILGYSMGQWLSICMIIAGMAIALYLAIRVIKEYLVRINKG